MTSLILGVVGASVGGIAAIMIAMIGVRNKNCCSFRMCKMRPNGQDRKSKGAGAPSSTKIAVPIVQGHAVPITTPV